MGLVQIRISKPHFLWASTYRLDPKKQHWKKQLSARASSCGLWCLPSYLGQDMEPRSVCVCVCVYTYQSLSCVHLLWRSVCVCVCVKIPVWFSCLVMSDSATPWTAARQASLSITNSWSLLRLISIKLVMPSNHLIHCHPFLLPSVFPSITVSSSVSVLHIRWLKYWSFSFSISPFNEYSGLISFTIDWLDLLAV